MAKMARTRLRAYFPASHNFFALVHKQKFGFFFFGQSNSIFPLLHSFLYSQFCCPPYRIEFWLSTFPGNDEFNLRRVVGKKQNCQWIFSQNVAILCVNLSGVKMFPFFHEKKVFKPPPPPSLLRPFPR